MGDDGLRPEPDEHLRSRRAGAEHRLQGHRGAAGHRGRRRVAREALGAVRPRHDALRGGAGAATGSSTGRASTSTASTRFTRNSSASGTSPTRSGRAGPIPRRAASRIPRFLGRDGRPYGPLPRSGRSSRAPTTTATRPSSRTPSATRRSSNWKAPKRTARRARSFTRTLEIGKSSHDLLARIAPAGVAVAVVGDSKVSLGSRTAFTLLKIPAAATPTRVKVLMAKGDADVTRGVRQDYRPPAAAQATHRGRAEALAGDSQDHRHDRQERRPVRRRYVRPSGAKSLERPTPADRLRLLPDGKRMAVCTGTATCGWSPGSTSPKTG